MTDEEQWDGLRKTFKKVFSDDVVITEQTTAADVPGWDSLNHVRLIVSLEKMFKVRFNASEVSELKTVGDLKRLISQKQR